MKSCFILITIFCVFWPLQAMDIKQVPQEVTFHTADDVNVSMVQSLVPAKWGSNIASDATKPIEINLNHAFLIAIKGVLEKEQEVRNESSDEDTIERKMVDELQTDVFLDVLAQTSGEWDSFLNNCESFGLSEPILNALRESQSSALDLNDPTDSY